MNIFKQNEQCVDEFFDSERIERLRESIRTQWKLLVRLPENLGIHGIEDPKISEHLRPPVYVSPQEDLPSIIHKLHGVQVRVLPKKTYQIRKHGLLYLPYPYVVPGGRFNEMYGWDSYFILLGLLRDQEFELARNMVDNALYQVKFYGRVLNANRTYYLTRSHPPFLTRMVLAIYPYIQEQSWLANALEGCMKYYETWLYPHHRARRTGLFRYRDSGRGPCIEVCSELDKEGYSHYERVAAAFEKYDLLAGYKTDLFYDREKKHLRPLYYLGDRAMRESGFDPTDRFGPVGGATHQYAPVCLNTLMYVMAQDIAEMHRMLNSTSDEQIWQKRADELAQKINQLLWSEKDGLYLDLHYPSRTKRYYPFATAFYPLWAGICDPSRAYRMVPSILQLLETPGGLQTSSFTTGCQWDAPYGWAPLHFIACSGLSRYGYIDEARRLARKFMLTVLDVFEKTGSIFEKYDLTANTAEIETAFGYVSNEIGFGWTNGVIAEWCETLFKEETSLIKP